MNNAAHMGEFPKLKLPPYPAAGAPTMSTDEERRILSEVHAYLGDLRKAEATRNRTIISDSVTNRRVLEAVQELGAKVDVRFTALEHRVTGAEARLSIVETRKSQRPPAFELGLQVSGTGNHYVTPDGRVLTIEQAQKWMVEQAIKEDHDREAAATWRGLKSGTRQIIIGVLVVVLASAVSLAVGLSLAHSHVPEQHETR
jgi:hypothetical protein